MADTQLPGWLSGLMASNPEEYDRKKSEAKAAEAERAASAPVKQEAAPEAKADPAPVAKKDPVPASNPVTGPIPVPLPAPIPVPLPPKEESKAETAEKPVKDAAPTAKEKEPAKEVTAKAEPAPQNDEAVLKAIEDLGKKMDQMNLLFKQEIQNDSREEEIAEQVQAKLQKYKDDLYSRLVRPILMDVIELRESIRRNGELYTKKPEAERLVPLKTFLSYTEDTKDILEKNNITVFDSKEGDELDSLKQRVIRQIPTEKKELDGKIAESLSSGYACLGTILSPEKVTVYEYRKK